MAAHNINPVREQLRGEMLKALSNCREPMTTGAIYEQCPSAVDAREVARLAYEMKKSGIIADGGKVLHQLGMKVNSYVMASDPRFEAAKPIVVERKIPRTSKPPKPAQDHPFKACIVAQEAHDGAPRVTRPLPTHLQSTAPQAAAVALDEDDMSEEPMPYITEPDSFNQEPMAPEAEEDIDADLVDALLELEHLEPQEAAVGEVLSMASPTNICQCQRATLPTLPPGYLYGGLRVWIDNEHDPGRLTLTTVDEGAGAFLTLKARGRLAFDTGELVMLGQVGDELIRLHDRMDKQNND